MGMGNSGERSKKSNDFHDYKLLIKISRDQREYQTDDGEGDRGGQKYFEMAGDRGKKAHVSQTSANSEADT